MFDQDHGNVLSCFNLIFGRLRIYITAIPEWTPHTKTIRKYQVQNKTHGESMFKCNQNFFNEIKDLKLYGAVRNKAYFRRKYKLYLLNKGK